MLTTNYFQGNEVATANTYQDIRNAVALGRQFCLVNGVVPYDGGGQTTVDGTQLIFRPDSGIDFLEAPTAMILNTFPILTHGPRQIFLNCEPAAWDSNTDDAASISGEFSGRKIDTAWFGIHYGEQRDPGSTNWKRLQSAIDAGSLIKIPRWSNRAGINGGFINLPIRLDRGSKRLEGSGRSTKIEFVHSGNGVTQGDRDAADVHGAITMGTSFTLATARYETSLEEVELYQQEDIQLAMIYSGCSLEEKTGIRKVQIDEFAQYGIRLSGGNNGMEIKDINSGGHGHYTGGTERGFILKDGPESNPRGLLTIDRVTHNASSGAAIPVNGIFGFCLRNRGRVALTGCHFENQDIAYKFDEADNPTNGHVARVEMHSCDHRAVTAADTSIQVTGAVGKSRLKLEVTFFDDLDPAIGHTILDDQPHGINFSGQALEKYRRNGTAVLLDQRG